MIKKTLIASVLVMLIVAFSVPASATTSTPYLDDQVYKVSGKITVKIDIRDYVTLSVTIPKVEKYGEMFIFFGDGTWMDYLLYTAATADSSYTSGIDYPTWTQSGANFTIDLSDMADSIESALGSYVNLSGGATKNPVITGKVSGKSISGKMNLGWNMSTYVEGMGNISGSITISMTYKGTWYTYVSYSSLAASSLAASESKMDLQKAVQDAIVSALSSLPKKDQKPAQ
jgi:hypothetical protein